MKLQSGTVAVSANRLILTCDEMCVCVFLCVLSQGFRQLKVVRGRNTTAFVEFDSIENATQAHNTQQVSYAQRRTRHSRVDRRCWLLGASGTSSAYTCANSVRGHVLRGAVMCDT